jgi:FkbM family methyltransferase
MHGLFFNPPIEENYIGHIVAEIYKDRIYDPFLRGQKGLTILDIGANIGIFSYYASQFAEKIYALEPSLEHFATLQHQLAFNHLENVCPFKLALANFTGKAEFYHNQNKTMYSLMPAVQDPKLGGLPQKELVDCITIEDFLNQNKIGHVDFMKLDAEGAEFDILGGEAFAKVAERICMILVESHYFANPKNNKLLESLKRNGYRVKQIPNEASLWIAARESKKIKIPIKIKMSRMSLRIPFLHLGVVARVRRMR